VSTPSESRRERPITRATKLALERTDLAMLRTYWAADRTLMGWIRTSLAMISFGFTIGKIGRALEGSGTRIRPGELDGLAYFLLIIGVASLVAAVVQHEARVRSLVEHGLPRQRGVGVAFGVALLLIVTGAVALAALVLRL
jgi:putative membrane protein